MVFTLPSAPGARLAFRTQVCNRQPFMQQPTEKPLKVKTLLLYYRLWYVMILQFSLFPRPSITANVMEGLVKLLSRMTSGGHLEAWLIVPSTVVYRKCHASKHHALKYSEKFLREKIL